MNCSFCGNGLDDADILVGGPGIPAVICDECVNLCRDIISEYRIRRIVIEAQRTAFYEIWGTD